MAGFGRMRLWLHWSLLVPTLGAGISGGPPLRRDVATALYQHYVRNASANATARVHVGVVGSDGHGARLRPAASYARALTSSRLVVTCSPDPWEGDSRLGEALKSGALVLSDRLLDPLPGLVDGTNVVFYDSIEDMLSKVAHYLAHPDEAERIARLGPRVAPLPARLIEHVLGTAGLLDAPGPQPVRVFVEVPKNIAHHPGTFQTLLDGISDSKHATRVHTVAQADAIVIDLIEVDPGMGRFYKKRGEVKRTLDRRWPEIQSARADGQNGTTPGHFVRGKALPVILALDYWDSRSLKVKDPRLDYYFKRSRVHRLPRPHWAASANLTFPLFYAVKKQITREVHKQIEKKPKWEAREKDLSCFFRPS